MICKLQLSWIALAGLSAAAMPVAGAADSSPVEPAPSRLTAAAASAFFDGLVPHVIQTADVPGAIVVVVKNGQVLFAKGYGWADVAARRPMDARDTVVRLGSISKTFTWTAVMQLVEKGKLDLDQDVNAYLDFRLPERFGQPITLRHLLTHTAGFEETYKDTVPKQVVPLDGYLKQHVPAELFPPGDVVAYANYGTALAGYIVERVSGEPFNDYARRHLFAPLGMQSSTFEQILPLDMKRREAKAYARASEEPRPHDFMSFGPAGSVSSTGLDVARWMITHLQEGRLGDARILAPVTAQLMHRRAYSPAPQHDIDGMVLGFWEETRNAHRALVHGGDVFGAHSYMTLLMADGVGLFFGINAESREETYALRVNVFRRFVDEFFPAPLPPLPPATSTALQHGREIAGNYMMSRTSMTSFYRAIFGLAVQLGVSADEDGILRIDWFFNQPNGTPVRWREVAPYVWRNMDGPGRLVAVHDDGGRLRYLTSDLMPPVMVLMPPPLTMNKNLNLSVLAVTLTILLASALLWSVAAVVRRIYTGSWRLSTPRRPGHRLMRAASAFNLGVLLLWASLFAFLADLLGGFTSDLDPVLYFLHFTGWVALAGTGFVLFHTYQVVREPGENWRSKTSVILHSVGCLGAAWLLGALHLLFASPTY